MASLLLDKSIIVIGLGNLTRGDDAIGRLALRALAMKRLQGIRLIEIEGEATQLLETLSAASGAIVIDACRSGAPVGTIYRFDVAQAPIPSIFRNLSSHGLGMATGLELARTFGQLPSQCVVFAIEVMDFTPGAALSAQAAARIDDLLISVEQEVEIMRLAIA